MTRTTTALLAGLPAAALLGLAAAPADAGTRCGASYDVRPGDTLYEIAQSCRVTLSHIMALNPGLDPQALEVGEDIRLAADAPRGPQPQPRQTSGGYQVGQGDTMSSIATRLGVSLFELIAENEDVDPFNLRVGSEIDVPDGSRPQAGFAVTPHEGEPGTPVDIRARNLRPNDWVAIGAGETSSDWRVLREAQVDRSGRLSTRVTVPDDADRGDSLIFVVDTDRGLTLKSEPFRVTGDARWQDGRDDDWNDDRDDGDNRRDIGEAWTVSGHVERGVECPVLVTADGDRYALTGDDLRLTPGERIRVEGDPVEISYCQQGEATLQVASVTELGRAGDPGDRDSGDWDNGDRDSGDRWDGDDRTGSDDRIVLEGAVRQGAECNTLTTRDGDTYAIISDDIPFTNGEWVRVEGDTVGAAYCQQGEATVDVHSLREVPRS